MNDVNKACGLCVHYVKRGMGIMGTCSCPVPVCISGATRYDVRPDDGGDCGAFSPEEAKPAFDIDAYRATLVGMLDGLNWMEDRITIMKRLVLSINM